ncbi:hypothetical protein OV079_47410 [Nannocystis pusilla]|uniref:Myxococcus cysteine-rich repeat-containing protein n=1 Tax=Nannocystis pusilla TaxID=889268 RepID=A0A9X3F7C7_9BACT|nr:hypothetical protein [Nannocystis pusilla]MCY1013038.1 hypothetical protein [Nannocystis pusilla]
MSACGETSHFYGFREGMNEMKARGLMVARMVAALVAALGAMLVGCRADCPSPEAVVMDRRSTRTLCVGDPWGDAALTSTTWPDAAGMTTTTDAMAESGLTESIGSTAMSTSMIMSEASSFAEQSESSINGDSPFCGNGIQEAGEACDDGNVVDDDACLSTCVEAKCGDGFVWADMEVCDDGNADDDDRCLGTCVPATCGDGHLNKVDESCDDGNVWSGDGCDSSCDLEYLMFATQAVFPGSFGTKAAADIKCQNEAAASGLPGTYVAWLSFSLGDLALAALPAGERLMRTDGVSIVFAAEALLKGDNTALMASVSLDAKGDSVAGFAWTGTLASGEPGADCSMWKAPENLGLVGSLNGKDAKWTQAGLSGCDELHHLYCFRRKDD